jgi:hypothetical protein
VVERVLVALKAGVRETADLAMPVARPVGQIAPPPQTDIQGGHD